MSEPHMALGNYYYTSEVISFTLIGMTLGGWICVFVTIGICLCVNNSKVQPLAYRLIATTPSTTPVEVIVEQETQVITTTTGAAPVEEKGPPKSNKSMAKTKSGTASAATPTKGT